ncbi:unnamed protein product [Paramecium primaurelia]|uniref:Uncharacterized protein n=1 Tax=Paramecium primaurelia TaxID=5886 RepID=A0A8S1MBH9_PARPR|nr:unnamed protein product [Paramecium primaurelia]
MFKKNTFNLYKCTSLIKQQTPNEILQQKKYIQKQYLKHPKPQKIYPGTLEDLYFKFHCYGSSMTFDDKMDILQNMVNQNSEFKYLSFYGVPSIISSLTKELKSLNYSDTDEYNISQFINILHQIKYYDQQSWIAAMDNYHKQGVLNWYQYTEFTHAVYDFSGFLNEIWHLNIVKDISQEAFCDFIGFVENKRNLDLCEKELNRAYQHLRKFKVFATKNQMLVIMQYFMYALKQPPVSLETYQFIFFFCMDHLSIQELDQANRALFLKLIQQFHMELNEFQDINKLISNFEDYILLINMMLKYHEEIDQPFRDQFADRILNLFLKGELENVSYDSLKNLNILVEKIQNQKCFKFANEVILMINELSLVNLKNIKKKKQDLLSIYQIFEKLDDKDQILSVLAKSNLNLDDVNFTHEDLIVFLKQLDQNDLVYYLTEFLESTLTYVAKNINDFQPDDWCFTFYLVYKYVIKDHEDASKFDNDLNILKQYIKLRYMTSYRQTIPTNSSYYKILSVVEIEVFFADDLLNLY